MYRSSPITAETAVPARKTHTDVIIPHERGSRLFSMRSFAMRRRTIAASLTIFRPIVPLRKLYSRLPMNTAAQPESPDAPAIEISANVDAPLIFVPENTNPAASSAINIRSIIAFLLFLSSTFIFITTTLAA